MYRWQTGLIVVCLALAATHSLLAAERPNIIFVLTDDHRWDALGYAGNKIIQTPNLDRLAASGVVFRNNFVTTSICNVSRASILTGQYLRRHNIVDFSTPLNAQRWAETYPKLLREAGYRTGFIGKFGVGDPKAIAGMAKEFDYWKGLPGQAGLFFDKDDPKTHKTAKFGDQALEFLRGCEPGKPFCLSISFNAPHARDNQPREFWPDERDEKLYTDATIPVPSKATESWFNKLPKEARESEGRRRYGWRFDNPEKYQRIVKDYYRLITGIDREIGRITTLLAEKKLAENTVIIFTGDNGFFLGERGLADKWLMYEESIRTPLFIVDPRLPATKRGKTVEAITLNVDFAPTMLALAGIKIPGGMQGRSLLPLLAGETPKDWRTEFYYEHRTLPGKIPPTEGIRGTRWKYVRWTKTEPLFEELFDLQTDPGEEKNLIHDPKYADILRQMRERTKQYGSELR